MTAADARRARSEQKRARLESYAEYRRRGWKPANIAAELGITVRTAQNYERELREREGRR